MRPQLHDLIGILPNDSVRNVLALRDESIHHIDEVIATVSHITEHIETLGRERSRQLIIEAAKQLAVVKRSVEQIDDHTSGDHTGFVADLGRSVIVSLADADAAFQKAADTFAQTRCR